MSSIQYKRFDGGSQLLMFHRVTLVFSIPLWLAIIAVWIFCNNVQWNLTASYSSFGAAFTNARGEIAVVEFENDDGRQRTPQFEMSFNGPSRIVPGQSWDVARLGRPAFSSGPPRWINYRPTFYFLGIGLQKEVPYWARYDRKNHSRIFTLAVPCWAAMVFALIFVTLVRSRMRERRRPSLGRGFAIRDCGASAGPTN